MTIFSVWSPLLIFLSLPLHPYLSPPPSPPPLFPPICFLSLSKRIEIGLLFLQVSTSTKTMFITRLRCLKHYAGNGIQIRKIFPPWHFLSSGALDMQIDNYRYYNRKKNVHQLNLHVERPWLNVCYHHVFTQHTNVISNEASCPHYFCGLWHNNRYTCVNHKLFYLARFKAHLAANFNCFT